MKFKELEKRNINIEEFINICKEKPPTQIIKDYNLSVGVFIRYAKFLNCYFPKQGNHNKGSKKGDFKKIKFFLEDWENNLKINITRASLRRNLMKYNIFPSKCDCCKNELWLENPIPLEIEHINGNKNDHRKSNIIFICPNCHVFTDTYKGKNKKNSVP